MEEIETTQRGSGTIRWRLYYIDPVTKREYGFGPVINMKVEVKENLEKF